MILYRISNANYSKDLSGKGAALFGGRWNSKGNSAIYLSSHVSLALLEILVNYTYEQLNQIQFEIIEFEMNLDKPFEIYPTLNENWRYLQSYSKAIGDKFLFESKKLMLKVPSAIIDLEYNYLVNPNHADFKKMKINKIIPLQLDNRLMKLV